MYKAEITIPIAFEVAASQPDDIGAQTRRHVRDAMVNMHLLERMVKDIRTLLAEKAGTEDESNSVYLWDLDGLTANGRNFSDESDDEGDAT